MPPGNFVLVRLKEIDGEEAHLRGGCAEVVQGNLLVAPAADRLLDSLLPWNRFFRPQGCGKRCQRRYGEAGFDGRAAAQLEIAHDPLISFRAGMQRSSAGTQNLPMRTRTTTGFW